MKLADSKSAGGGSEKEREHKLFIGMIPKTATEEFIRTIFDPFGEIREVHIIRDQDGNNKGCAFLKFTERQSAMSAIESVHQQYVVEPGGRPLIVKFADNKRERGQNRARKQPPWSGAGAMPLPPPFGYPGHHPPQQPQGIPQMGYPPPQYVASPPQSPLGYMNPNMNTMMNMGEQRQTQVSFYKFTFENVSHIVQPPLPTR